MHFGTFLSLCVFGLFLLSALESPAIIYDRPENYQKYLIKFVDPQYPAALYRRGIQGRGNYRLTINQKTGEVDEVKVLKSAGHAVLNELAAKAFFQWRFRPGVPHEVTVSYEFQLTGFSRSIH